MFHLIENKTYYAIPGYWSDLWGWGYNWYNLFELPDRYMPIPFTSPFIVRERLKAESEHLKFTFSSVNATSLEVLKAVPEYEVARIIIKNKSPFCAEGEALFLTNDVEVKISVSTLDGFIGKAALQIIKYTPISDVPLGIPRTDFYYIQIQDSGILDSSGRSWFPFREYFYIPAENKLMEPKGPYRFYEKNKLIEFSWSITQSGISIPLNVGEDLRMAYEGLKSELSEKNKIIAQKEEIVAKLNTTLGNLKEETEHLRADLEHLRADYDSLKSVHETLVKELIASRNLMYMLTGITVILVFLVIYLAKRRWFHTYPPSTTASHTS
jgi:hypothetical protein